MAESAARQIVEALGFVGVIGSLIFVGVEVQQNSIATRAATNASVAEAFHEQNLMLASSPELAAAIARNAENPKEASLEDTIQLLGAWRGLFQVLSS